MSLELLFAIVLGAILIAGHFMVMLFTLNWCTLNKMLNRLTNMSFELAKRIENYNEEEA